MGKTGKQFFGGIRGAVAMAVLSASPALAQSVTPNSTTAFHRAADWVKNLLTGPLGTSVAVIAIAVVGYMWWAGRMELNRVLGVVGGIALVFGGAQLVDLLQGATGGK